MRWRSTSVSGHFGELLQGRLGNAGPIALITLPCAPLKVHAQMRPAAGLRLHGAGQRLLAPARTHRFLRDLGIAARGHFLLRADAQAGSGAGVSTAALVALAKSAGADLPANLLAQACLQAEGASDPLMFPNAERLLWASRQGRVLAHLPPLLRFDILGGFWGKGQLTDPADIMFPDIADLLAQWPGADLPAMARLTSEGAARSLALRGPADDPIAHLANDLGALGYVIAHTGSARGLIYAPGTIPPGGAAALRAAGLRKVMRFRAGGRSL